MTIKCKLADHGRLPRRCGSGQEYVDLVSVGDNTIPPYFLKLYWRSKELKRESLEEVLKRSVAESSLKDWVISYWSVSASLRQPTRASGGARKDVSVIGSVSSTQFPRRRGEESGHSMSRQHAYSADVGCFAAVNNSIAESVR